jgi:Uma2 family endonuclease
MLAPGPVLADNLSGSAILADDGGMMSVAQSEPRYTEAEYLALERESEERHEYLDGHIYAMAGESPEHGIICMNLSRIISTHLLGTACQAFAKDMKVRSGPDPRPRGPSRGLYSYPDLVVVCGEMKFHDERRDVLLNPAVIVEVLSPTTEAFDRGEKFFRYQTWNQTLTDYVLVSQSAPFVGHYIRQPDGSWTYYVYHGLEQVITVKSIACTLRLSDVYDRIEFPYAEQGEDDEV